MSGEVTSVYLTPEAETQHMAIYDDKLAKWPTPYESVMVDTTYGDVHVIVSGPEDGPPLLLLNASGMSGWSWFPNVGTLNQHHRTYAIDTMGEAGKSRLDDLSHFPEGGEGWTDLLIQVTDHFDIDTADVIGASYGGFIATNYARYAPERVKSLALLGPMGLTPSTGKTVARIMVVQFFPLPWLQDWATQWALGKDPNVLAEAEAWFRVIMTGMQPKVTLPVTFTPEDLQAVQAPTLLILGAKDNLTGNPKDVEQLARNVSGIRIDVLDTGHLIGVEDPEAVNQLLHDFLTP
jgi:pimeloyl-ACP methyl ester carboxylesterase